MALFRLGIVVCTLSDRARKGPVNTTLPGVAGQASRTCTPGARPASVVHARHGWVLVTLA
jgi:hypothetical protein